MKAIKIDSGKKEIYEVEVTSENGNQLKSIYAHLGCGTFTLGRGQWRNGDSLYVDDNGLFIKPEDVKGVFKIDGQPQPMVGNGLVVGVDGEGDAQDVRSTIEEIKAQVKWSSVEELQEYLGRPMPLT